MDLIDAYTLLASNRTLLLTLLFLLIPGFGLLVASLYLTRENVRWKFFFGRSLPFNWKGLAILLNVTSLALLLAAALLLTISVHHAEKSETNLEKNPGAIDVPELDQALRSGRNETRGSPQ